MLRVRADCGGRLFTAKLGIIVHYLPHQLLDHLLADDRILLTVFAIASMTSSASAVSTLPEPACPIPQSWSQEPVHVGGLEVGITRAGETVARSTLAHTLQRRSCFSVFAADTFTSVHRFKGSIPQ